MDATLYQSRHELQQRTSWDIALGRDISLSNQRSPPPIWCTTISQKLQIQLI